ncbi:MAG TPA: beta-mannanase [Gammaproteobacteria bacterium]|nr:beta-mannanase [Gammaproteobacteria bacterium]
MKGLWFALALLLAGCGGGADTAANLKAQWIRDAYATIASGHFPRLKAVSWWHENWDPVSLRIDSSEASLQAYREAVSDDAFVTEARFSGGKLLPPGDGRYYLAAFPDFCGPEDCVSAERIRDFEVLAGKPIVWAYFSDNWFDPATGQPRIRFPRAAVEAIDAAGRVPFVRLMARTRYDEGMADPVFSMQAILDGEFDDALRGWAIAAREWDKPLLVEFGTEVNGEWFPWNGLHNGGGRTDGYGAPQLADGPERFRDAYRHIIDIFRAEAATKLTWFFHVNADSEPVEDWNSMAAYYPGDDYIDWIGVSVYNGSWVRDEDLSFREILDRAWPELTALSSDRPIAVLELGMSEQR